MSRRRTAFSLIELLVVISIIAVLLGILLPVLPKVRDAARKSVCGSNLRNIGQAVTLYVDANRQVFPSARYMPPPWLSGDNDPALNVRLDDYLEKDSGVYRCPGDRIVYFQEYTPPPTNDNQNPQPTKCGMSYTYVVSLGGQQYEQTFFYRFLRQTPSDTPVAYDFDGGTFETMDRRMVRVNFFHTARNVLFVDGHVGKYGE